jgi:DNA-directed RNA polymerase subunit E'/Rpb7
MSKSKQIKKEKSNIIETTQNVASAIHITERIHNNVKNTFQTSLLHSPYIETTLKCPIMLSPTQMDNKLQLHLKSNLNNTVKGRCYLNYGHIIKINKIDEISDGIIEQEDSTCSAKFLVKFSCRLCYPIKNKEIICKIDRMNKALISGINGPIKAIITPDEINKDKFYPDNDRNIRTKNTSQILETDMYIKVLILASTFNHYDVNVIVISHLQDMATEEEIKLFLKDQMDNQS